MYVCMYELIKHNLIFISHDGVFGKDISVNK